MTDHHPDPSRPGTPRPGTPAPAGFPTPRREERRRELARNLEAVERRIADACAASGRSRTEVTLVVVTKTYPASDVRLLASLGVSHVAENRDQEAAAKAAACADLPLTWHFVGQLQTNKARSVVRYADVVHSVDRPRLVRALSDAVVRAGRPELYCLVQVALDKEPGVDKEPGAEKESWPDGESGAAGVRRVPGARAGVPPADVPALAAAIAGAPGLRLGGVMTVAPLTGRYAGDPRAAFERLADLASAVRAADPAATMVSAGMSGDLEAAVAAGATHVRVGTAVLGARPPLR